jgi:hypothetical protein
VGSKIFLLGEYQVLKPGAALLVSVEPRFKMIVKRAVTPGSLERPLLAGINVGSPADLYYRQELGFFKDWEFEFIDPHAGRGGFGASTAQMVLLQGFREGDEGFHSHSQFDFDLRKLHKKYLEVASGAAGTPPSGADLLAQFQGGMVEIDLGASKIERHSWPFPQWQVLFFATGQKLATHEHLKNIAELDVESLRVAYQQTLRAFRDGQAMAFAEGFRRYQQELAIKGWQASTTTNFLEAIHRLNGVVAAKGCGAMGADVIAVLVDSKHELELIPTIETLGLKYTASLDDRTEGFTWKWISESALNQEVTW